MWRGGEGRGRRFDFEDFLNALLIGRGLGLAVVDWPDVRHRAKADKYGFWPGVQGDIGMIADLLRGAPIEGRRFIAPSFSATTMTVGCHGSNGRPSFAATQSTSEPEER